MFGFFDYHLNKPLVGDYRLKIYHYRPQHPRKALAEIDNDMNTFRKSNTNTNFYYEDKTLGLKSCDTFGTLNAMFITIFGGIYTLEKFLS